MASQQVLRARARRSRGAAFILQRIFRLILFSAAWFSFWPAASGKSGAALAQDESTGGGDFSHTAHPAVQYLFPEQLSVSAGKPATADLHFRIASGLHINSHKPYEKNLIPTNLMVVEEPGLKVAAVDFPAGKDFAFSFAPTEKISVYSDEFVLHAHLTAERGDHLLQAKLRYQACDASTCFPPKTIPVAIDIIAK